MAIKNFGVDLSYCNNITDYNVFLKSTYNGLKCKYAFLRIGYIYNGVEKKDKLFEKHYKNLVGKIPLGIYIYSYATTVDEAKKEAKWVLEQIKDLEIQFPVVFDYEDSYMLNLKLTKRQYTDICKAFLDEIQKNNYYAMLYCNPNLLNNYLYKEELSNYPLWLAHYTTEGNEAKMGQAIWQFGTYKPSGAIGEIDANYCYRQLAKIIRDNKMNKRIRYLIKAQKIVYDTEKDIALEDLTSNGFTVICDKLKE